MFKLAHEKFKKGMPSRAVLLGGLGGSTPQTSALTPQRNLQLSYSSLCKINGTIFCNYMNQHMQKWAMLFMEVLSKTQKTVLIC